MRREYESAKRFGTCRAIAMGAAISIAAPANSEPFVANSGGWQDRVIVAQNTPAPATTPTPAPPQPQGQTTPPPPTQPSTPPAGELPPVKVIQTPQEKRRPTPVQTSRSATRTVAATAPAATQVSNQPPASGAPSEASVRISPVAGSEVPVGKVPGAVGIVTAEDIARSGASTAQEALQQRVPGIVLSDQQGNEFQTNIQYRGFTSSPVSGTPQGLAVYQNGVRINEVFGDIVNYDFLPSNAIKDIAVLSGNPLYGLNAIGGAITIDMKDGFGFQGVESDTRFGSYGRRQESLQLGAQSGNVAAYVAAETVHDDGWRDASPAFIHRMYADIGVKPSGDSEIHINYSGAVNFVGAAAPSPIELLRQDWSKIYTNPQTTLNRLSMTSINGTTALTDSWGLSGVGYYRQFRQKHLDGNVSNAAPCASDATLLCLGGDVGDTPNPAVRDANGNPISAANFGDVAGELDRTRNETDSYGASVQATNKAELFGHKNLFIIGTSVDHGVANTTSNAELGTIDPTTLTVRGTGDFPVFPLTITPESLRSTTNYYGVFFADTFDVTDRLAITAGGRYNYAQIDLADQNAAFKAAAFPGEISDLSGDHLYVRFNPSLGATYKINSGLSLYGGYSEANRAPTPAELACSNPAQPCLLENFLVSDPNLKQVVSHTWEAGLRGNFKPPSLPGNISWTFGLFHTLNTDDILSVLDPVDRTRGFFQNAGNTLRQGIEANVTYTLPRASIYANYAFIDATFQSNITLSSPNNPQNTTGADGFQINVRPGDHIPAIPEHRIKAGFEYELLDHWKLGADVVYASSQYFVGDENNRNAKLPSYAVVKLHTSYEISKNVQIYGIVNNLFDNRYALYGTYFQTQDFGSGVNFTDARTETPAAPLSAYAGLKIKF